MSESRLIAKIAKICFSGFMSVLFYSFCFGYPLFENEDFTLTMDTYFRTDLVGFKKRGGFR